MTTARSLHELDIVIGRRIKLARINSEMSQAELAKKLGVSVQMLQRYERGLNRVSASRLRDLADIMKTDFEYFVEDPKHSKAGSAPVLPPLARPTNGGTGESSLSQAMELLGAFDQIKDANIRNHIVSLTKSIAEQ